MIVEVLTGVAVFLMAGFLSELVGYLVHRLAHVPGTSLYESHMRHHFVAYPPKDFMSKERYRHVGRASFTVWFLPIYVLFIGIQFLLLPVWLFVVAAAATSLAAAINIYIHDWVHVDEKTLPGKWFKRVRLMHLIHHANLWKNYGIWQFGFDSLFGTRQNPSRRGLE